LNDEAVRTAIHAMNQGNNWEILSKYLNQEVCCVHHNSLTYTLLCFKKQWFELYPEFLSNPFFIAGESYAGVYVPTLASEVVKGSSKLCS